ncbi:MAG TPA: right-handed parallel beta-helix repeat-containing protein [Stellaceae bacterium]|nr:right-handed parallel beta-helix repeat-containing protein [Stellaceae bacterium]
MSVLNVGSGQQYTTLASAIAAARDGDTIEVQAGTYTNDFAIITHDVTIEGVGGMVDLVATQSPPNGKAILTTDANVTIENVTFSGASVPDGNGAGIRYETGNLVLDNDVFKNNQEGLLAADDPQGSITITNSTFTHNGKGDGQTHNLYVGDIGTLTIDHSTFTDAVVGHEIKSRAETTIIENSLIADGPTGSASYSIDLPNGGNATIRNNVIEQGPETQNPTIIAFGEEGNVHAGSSLTIAGNTIVNDLAKPDAQLLWNATGATASLAGNAIYGLAPGQLGGGIAETGTIHLASEPALALPAAAGGPPGTPPAPAAPADPIPPADPATPADPGGVTAAAPALHAAPGAWHVGENAWVPHHFHAAAVGGRTPGHPAAPDWLLQAMGEPTHGALREALGALEHHGHEGGPLTLAHILPQGQHLDFVPHH